MGRAVFILLVVTCAVVTWRLRSSGTRDLGLHPEGSVARPDGRDDDGVTRPPEVAEGTAEFGRSPRAQPAVGLPGAGHSAVEDSWASRLDPFTRAFQRELTVSELGDPSFAEARDSPLDGLRIVVHNAKLSVGDLRALYESSAPDSPLRCWAVLGVAYGSELGTEDLAWLEELATISSPDPGPVQLAAIHAVRAASGFDALDSAEAMQRVVSALLSRTGEGTARWTDASFRAALRVALDPLERLPATSSVAELERLAWADGTPEEISEVIFKTLARAGGADGAQAVLSAVLRGEKGAMPALRSVRDENAEPQLRTWIEAGTTGGDTDLAAAALTGLIATGSEIALATLDSLLKPMGPGAGEASARRRRIALEGLAQLDEPCSRGLFWRIWHQVGPLENDPELARSLYLADDGTMVKESLKPPGEGRGEICDQLSRALDVLPRDSEAYALAMFDLARIARREDVLYIEANLMPDMPQSPAIEQALRRARTRRE